MRVLGTEARVVRALLTLRSQLCLEIGHALAQQRHVARTRAMRIRKTGRHRGRMRNVSRNVSLLRVARRTLFRVSRALAAVDRYLLRRDRDRIFIRRSRCRGVARNRWQLEVVVGLAAVLAAIHATVVGLFSPRHVRRCV